MCRLAGPVTLLYAVESFVQLSNSLYAGGFEDEGVVSACGLGASLAAIFGFTFSSGFVSAFNTFASSAVAAGNPKLAGTLFNKA